MVNEKNGTVRDKLEYWGMLFASVPWYYLPRPLSLGLGSLFGRFVAHCIPIRRQVAESNIQRAFPQKSRREVKKITVQTYCHFGKVFAELIRQDKYTRKDLDAIVTPVNVQVLQKALDQGNGVVLLLGHFGNWELLGYWLGGMGFPIHAVQRPQNNPLVNNVVNTKRTASGVKLISIFESASDFFAVLQSGRILFILADQDARDRGIFVDFFDIPSSTPRGAAVFARKLDAPIILAFPIRKPDDSYQFIFEELPYSVNTATNPNQMILQYYMDRLQYHVTLHPEQYFWFHRRWKTQPERQRVKDSVAPSLAGATG